MDNRYQFREFRQDIFIYNENVFNRENKHYDFKLHFSLSWKDYRAHCEAITEIMVHHLQQGTVDLYKYVQPTIAGDRYFDWLAGSVSPFHPITGKLLYYELSPSQERFIRGDQFTLYIPSLYDRDKLAQICIEVDAYMGQHGLQPGEKSDVAVSLTPYINMRLEYLRDGENVTRIDALRMYDKNPKERPQYQACVLQNTLFQYLYASLHAESSLEDDKSPRDTLEADVDFIDDKQIVAVPQNKKIKKSFKKNASAFFAKIFRKSDKSTQPKNDVFTTKQPS